MIAVYYACCDQRWDDSKFLLFIDALPVEIKGKILKFRNWKDSYRSLFGKLLLKRALEDLNIDSNLTKLKYNQFGRPYIDDAIDFNITHSGDYIICVISAHCRVGVDIELIRPINFDHFQKQFCKDQWNKIITSENKLSQFYFFWTLREAVIKADGRGFSIPIEAITFYPESVQISGVNWQYKTLKFYDDYILHVASDKQIPDETSPVKIIF